MTLSKEECREIIARRVAQEFSEGDVITLGIGLPTEVANHLPPHLHVVFQSENGLLGVGHRDLAAGENPKITNAGGIAVTTKTGAAFFDSQLSFAMIRGGHVDATVLGALQVDQQGNLANWMVPGRSGSGCRGQPGQLDHPRQEDARHGRRYGFGRRRQKSDYRHGTHQQRAAPNRQTLHPALNRGKRS